MNRRIAFICGMFICSCLSAQHPTAAPNPVVTPEPAPLPLLSSGLGALLGYGVLRKLLSKRRG